METIAAAELGIDIIILDHHIKDSDSVPPAAAVINPKISGSTYPFSGLSGCGVTAKWIWAFCFSFSDIYNRPLCLMTAEEDQGRTVFSMMKILNLLEKDRLIVTEDDPGIKEKIFRFLEGQMIVSYDAEQQKSRLNKIFGPHTDIHIADLKPEWENAFPNMKNLTLSEIKGKSRLLKYRDDHIAPVDILFHTFETLFLKNNSSLFQPFIKALDLTAIGTVADLMPLTSENHILVKKGFEILNRTERIPLKPLLAKLKLTGQPVGSQEISWQIAPFLNSAGRMGEAEKAVKLFLADNDAEIQSLIEEIGQLNKDRKKLSDRR